MGVAGGRMGCGGLRVDALLQPMADAPKSNEQFERVDSFQLSITQVRQAPSGRGVPRQIKPGPNTMKPSN